MANCGGFFGASGNAETRCALRPASTRSRYLAWFSPFKRMPSVRLSNWYTLSIQSGSFELSSPVTARRSIPLIPCVVAMGYTKIHMACALKNKTTR